MIALIMTAVVVTLVTLSINARSERPWRAIVLTGTSLMASGIALGFTINSNEWVFGATRVVFLAAFTCTTLLLFWILLLVAANAQSYVK